MPNFASLIVLGIAALMTVFAFGRRPHEAPPPPSLNDPRLAEWLHTLWGLEMSGALRITPDDVPRLAEAPNVYSDKAELLPWVLHTLNIARLRLEQINHQAKTRGTKYRDEDEQVFQRLLKDATFLEHLCQAALYARSDNYSELRPALLAMRTKYLDYFPHPSLADLALLKKESGSEVYYDTTAVQPAKGNFTCLECLFSSKPASFPFELNVPTCPKCGSELIHAS